MEGEISRCGGKSLFLPSSPNESSAHFGVNYRQQHQRCCMRFRLQAFFSSTGESMTLASTRKTTKVGDQPTFISPLGAYTYLGSVPACWAFGSEDMMSSLPSGWPDLPLSKLPGDGISASHPTSSTAAELNLQILSLPGWRSKSLLPQDALDTERLVTLASPSWPRRDEKDEYFRTASSTGNESASASILTSSPLSNTTIQPPVSQDHFSAFPHSASTRPQSRCSSMPPF